MATNNHIPKNRSILDPDATQLDHQKPPSKRRKVAGQTPRQASLPQGEPVGSFTPLLVTAPKKRTRKRTPVTAPVLEVISVVSSPADPGLPSEPFVPPYAYVQDLPPSEELVAQHFVQKEISQSRRGLRFTQIVGTTLAAISIYSLLSITKGFATELQPSQAATIAQGMIQDRMSDNIPKFQSYVKEQLPILMGRVPDYAKQQLPNYRRQLETQLENQIGAYAKQTAPQLEQQLDTFLLNNKEAVRNLVVNGGDPQASATLDENMRLMFLGFLNNTQVGGETLRSKIDQSLTDLTAVSLRVQRLADNKNLTDNEKRARRAVAILLKSVDDNPNLQQAAQTLQSVDSTPLDGALQWKSPDEAVFTAPGKPPVTFIRKNGSLPVAGSLPPTATAPAKKVTTK